MRINLKQAEIAAAIGLYMASRGLMINEPLDITFTQTRNPTGISADFEVPDFTPAKAEPKAVEPGVSRPFTVEQGTVLLSAAVAEPAADLPWVDTGGKIVGQASETVTVLEMPVDPVADLSQAINGAEPVAELAADPVDEVAAALAEDAAAEALEAEPANDDVAPAADTKSLFG